VGDFNGDGNTDIAVGTGSMPVDRSAILLGDGTGAFTVGPRFAAGTLRGLVAGDLNGDGRTDLALSTDSTALVFVLADSAGGFTVSPTNLSGFGGKVDLADFNDDGKLDFATFGGNDSRLAIFVQTPAAPTRTEYAITDICLPLSCYAWLLSDNTVAAGHNFAVYPSTGFLDFVQRTGQTFEPAAINKAGVIVGSAGFAQGQNPNTGYAAVWSPARSELLNLNPIFGWTRGIATSINNVGQIVGYSPDGPPIRGLVPGLSLNTVALTTDNLGILGTDDTGPLFFDYRLQGPLGVTRLPVTSLTLFNSAGQVLITAPQVGALFTPGSGITSQPPAPGFNVTAFNAAGQFIGHSLPGGTPGVYTAAGGVVPLNSLLPAGTAWTITGANAINNSGQILASATNGGRNTTILLSPVTGTSASGSARLRERAHEQPVKARDIAACRALAFNMRDVCDPSVRSRGGDR
jgi:hypothetical protein